MRSIVFREQHSCHRKHTRNISSELIWKICEVSKSVSKALWWANSKVFPLCANWIVGDQATSTHTDRLSDKFCKANRKRNRSCNRKGWYSVGIVIVTRRIREYVIEERVLQDPSDGFIDE